MMSCLPREGQLHAFMVLLYDPAAASLPGFTCFGSLLLLAAAVASLGHGVGEGEVGRWRGRGQGISPLRRSCAGLTCGGVGRASRPPVWHRAEGRQRVSDARVEAQGAHVSPRMSAMCPCMPSSPLTVVNVRHFYLLPCPCLEECKATFVAKLHLSRIDLVLKKCGTGDGS